MEWERKKRSPRLAALLFAAVALVRPGAPSGGDPLPVLKPLESAPVDRLNREELNYTGVAGTACSDKLFCNDGQACTFDDCIDGVCSFSPIPDCVPCAPIYSCPPIDLVFVMDTSGSMRDEATALCTGMTQVIFDLNQQGVVVRANYLGITQTPGGSFSCLTDNVLGLLGGTVPGDAASCPFPGGDSAYESWGPATAIVAERFNWMSGATRIIVPISDEGPCDGSLPEGCNDPGDDRASIDNAIAIATHPNNHVIVSPIVGSGADSCALNLATLLSQGTGGMVVQSKNPKLDLIDAIRQIMVSRCDVDETCDDQSVCTTDDHCRDGVCLGTPVQDCQHCEIDAECGDANPCTTDSCVSQSCLSTPGYDVEAECCDPSSGSITLVNDGNPCTLDICDPVGGQVSHPPSPQGTICNDQFPCTVMDVCNDTGLCRGTDIEAIPCTSNADCFGLECDVTSGSCSCGNLFPDLCLNAISESVSEPGCFSVGEDLFVTVDLGNSIHAIVGAQFQIQYDYTALDFIDIEPGAGLDSASPFSAELLSIVNEAEGLVFYAVGVFPGTGATFGPAMLARLRFRPLQECTSAEELCFLSNNPVNTVIVDDHGRRVPYTPCCTGELVIRGQAPELQCPHDQAVNADASASSALVTWPPATAHGQCDGALNVQCHAFNDAAVPFESLIATGGRFPVGRFEFECTATDSCGASNSCQWSVNVSGLNTVEVDVQLSAVMTSHLISRCIEFEFYGDCSEDPVVIEQTLDFGGLFNFPGSAHNVTLKVPKGKYGCVTARDPRHTLRSVALPEVRDGKYVISFAGDTTYDGNWLVNGNLNGDHVIDLLDHALLLAQYSAMLNPSTPCGTGSELHADLNGNGSVDSADLGFIQRHFLASDKGACCPAATGDTDPAEPSVISLEELDALGLPDLRAADADGDGMVSAEEIMSFLQGGPPADDDPP